MTKSELIHEVWKEVDLPKAQTERLIDTVFGVIRRELERGDEVQIIGFGKFHVRDRKERDVLNPRTGEKITISAHKCPYFTPGESLKRAVNR